MWHIFAQNPNVMKRILAIFISSLVLESALVAAPSFGAQVFIEPGQTPEQIDGWFRILRDSGFEYARIRMFGSHMQRSDGKWDFSLYDAAFSSAEKYGIRLFATLFPTTDELNDVGGFKFPKTEKQLSDVGEYIDNVVGHFKDSPALDTWVLQNEPGTGSLKVNETELSRKKRQEWESSQKKEGRRSAYLSADFSDQEFLVSYTEWYLRWISDRVLTTDSKHGRHINPHQILETIQEYDFPKYGEFITSFGSSMHFSWHFDIFERKDYPLGVSMMTDIIANNAGGKPYWITEFQGGAVTASGKTVLCPTADEVTQCLWTGVGAGIEGLMFWTLNQRKAVREAGEWGLLDFQGRPSVRLAAASEVAGIIASNKELFDGIEPLKSNITILYNNESLWMQKINASFQKDEDNPGRSKTAVMQSMAAAYSAICSLGVVPQICSTEFYDWSNPKGKVIVLPNIICVPSVLRSNLLSFVRDGGKVIATGLTGYYDEYMRCSFMGDWDLGEAFGAGISEFAVTDRYAPLPEFNGIRLDTHLWKGILIPETAAPFLKDGDMAIASFNKYGKGSVMWFPSMIDLGCRCRKEYELAAFYAEVLSSDIVAPVSFVKPSPGIYLRTMKSGGKYIGIVINKRNETVKTAFKSGLSHPEVIFASHGGSVKNSKIIIHPEETLVCVWD